MSFYTPKNITILLTEQFHTNKKPIFVYTQTERTCFIMEFSCSFSNSRKMFDFYICVFIQIFVVILASLDHF